MEALPMQCRRSLGFTTRREFFWQHGSFVGSRLFMEWIPFHLFALLTHRTDFFHKFNNNNITHNDTANPNGTPAAPMKRSVACSRPFPTARNST
jgi:hypothetical protein